MLYIIITLLLPTGQLSTAGYGEVCWDGSCVEGGYL